MSKIKNGRLDQYGAEPFKQQQFGTAGVEEVKRENVEYNINIQTSPDATASPGMNSSGKMFLMYQSNDLQFNRFRSSLRADTSPYSPCIITHSCNLQHLYLHFPNQILHRTQ